MPLVTPLERIGSVLAKKYRLDGVLGEGGMGMVFAATNLATGREVAIKLLHAQAATSSVHVERFLDEARAATAVRHPNVVDILDLDTTDDGAPFIVMERLQGETLRQLMTRGGPLDVALAWSILRPAMRAIGAAHEKGIVHRDLKPENIFLHNDGDGGRVTKVLDFGIAKLASSQRTAIGTQIGTARYMAPEQARGASVGPHTDVWAIAVIWYELVTGRLPFEFPRDATDAAVLAHILTHPPSSLTLRDGIPTAVGGVIDRALNPSHHERPQHMGALETELERAVVSAPAVAPVTRVRGVADPARLHSALAPTQSAVPRRGLSGLSVSLGVALLLLAVLMASAAIGCFRCLSMPVPLAAPVPAAQLEARCTVRECRFTNPDAVAGRMCVRVAVGDTLANDVAVSERVCSGELDGGANVTVPVPGSTRLGQGCLAGFCRVALVHPAPIGAEVRFREPCPRRAWTGSGELQLGQMRADHPYELVGSSDGWQLVRTSRGLGWARCATVAGAP